MSQIAESGATPEKEIVDFPTIITVICHLITLYALRPCEPIATNINRHIKVVLESSASVLDKIVTESPGVESLVQTN